MNGIEFKIFCCEMHISVISNNSRYFFNISRIFTSWHKTFRTGNMGL